MTRAPAQPWPEADQQRGEVHDLHARAGVLASESSLLGLASGLSVAQGVALLVVPTVVLPFARALLASTVGLLGIGLLLSALARLLGMGGGPRHAPWQQLWWPTWLTCLANALTQGAGLLLQSRHEAGLGTEPVAVLQVWSTGLTLVATAGLALGLLGLASVSLRQLATWWRSNDAPIGWVQLRSPALHLYTTQAHLLCGGVGLVALIGLAGQPKAGELHTYLAMAVTTLCVHAALPAVLLLGQLRRGLRPLRAAGVRLSTLERGYALAGGGVVLGLLLPGLAALANLLDVVHDGLGLSCALVAASSHAVRYGLVLLSWTKPQPLTTM